MTTSRCECCGVYFDSPSTRFYCSDPCQTWMRRRYSGKLETREQPAKAKPTTMSVNAARLAWLDASATTGTSDDYYTQRANDMLIAAALGKPRERRDLTGYERKI
jgi:hypothetical protein